MASRRRNTAGRRDTTGPFDKFTLKEFLEERKEYRERAEEQADAAKLDPEAAAKAKEEKRAAAEVEAMLNAIMAAKDAKDAEEKK